MKKHPALTEQRLLAADPADYMNQAQLDFFRKRLLEMRAELVVNATRTADEMKQMVVPSDPADRATLEEEYALELRTRERELRLSVKIDAALRRIEDGSYGYCEETGEPIGLPRLLARPTATLSIEAQERRERLQKSFAN
jgi:DnaK suppressor protein